MSDGSELNGSLGAIFGAITGMLYGVFLLFILAWLAQWYEPSIVAWSGGVFALVGWFRGAIIVDAFLALIHFLWGLLIGVSDRVDSRIELDMGLGERLTNIAFVGFLTGVSIWCAWRWGRIF